MTTESIGHRINYRKVAPEAIRALAAVERYARGSNLEPALLELVRLRASIINGCAYCVDMHSKDARARGESEPRLYAVSVWWEAPFFTPRERAALAWTEAVTKVNVDQVPDEVYRLAREHFEERELVDGDDGRYCYQQLESTGDFVPGACRHVRTSEGACCRIGVSHDSVETRV